MSFSQILEIAGFLIGLLYLWWEYFANPRVWLASVIMPAISMWVYFSKGLYADFAINIYYLAIAAYGYWAWTRKSNGGTDEKADTGTGTDGKKAALPIRHTPAAVVGGAVAATAVLWAAIWWVLVTFTNSTVPVADAFTTALSIVALWMMARKFAEQWLAWLVVDIVSSGLYLYKGLVFYAVLYLAYTVIAVFGYRKWLRLMQARQ